MPSFATGLILVDLFPCADFLRIHSGTATGALDQHRVQRRLSCDTSPFLPRHQMARSRRRMKVPKRVRTGLEELEKTLKHLFPVADMLIVRGLLIYLLLEKAWKLTR
jgi:hypothetical protein